MRIAARHTVFIALLLTALGPAPSAQSSAPSANQAPQPSWPRYYEAHFALLASVERTYQSKPPRDTLAELDRLQPQIALADLAVQGRAMLIRSHVLRMATDLAGAERTAQEARALGARSGHPFVEFDSLFQLAGLARDRGDLARGAAFVDEAVPIADRTRDDLLRFSVRIEQGRIARARGQLAASLLPLNEAVSIAAQLPNVVRPHVQALNARSAAKLGLSDYDGALADAQLAYEIAARPGELPDLPASATFALAQTLSQIGDLERGLDLYTEASEKYAAGNLPAGVGLSLRQRMDVRFALEDHDGALADGERARDILARTGSAGQEPALLSRLALIAARLGRSADSATYAAQAAARAGTAQPRVRAAVESDLAAAALQARDFADAEARYTRVLAQGRALRDLDVQWRALHGLGRAALGTSALPIAQTHFEAAIALIDRVRRTLPEAGLRADFVAERLGPSEGLIDTLLARSASPGDDWAARAFEIGERARGRALTDLLAEARARLTDPAIARVRTQDVDFGRRLSALQQSLADADTDAGRRRLVAEIERAEREYDAFVVRSRRETPRYTALAHPQPASASDVAARLAAGEALVSFWVGADRGTAWVITRAGLRSYRLPGRRDLDRDIARLKSAIAGGQIEDVQRLGQRLHETLLPNLDLARIQRLIVVPDGPLWRLPFAALRPPGGAGGWLVERLALSVVPSASLHAALRPAGGRTASRQPALIFGLEAVPDGVRALRALYDPRLLPSGPLRYAVTEAQEVARQSGADPGTSLFLNDRADETAFKRAASGRYAVVHVAAHALIDDRAPRRSALVLRSTATDDGLLQLHEIANLTIDADLVVLSTCQSQIGRAVRGEGLVSLSRAFILSGARAVAASLWAVDDRETSRLMPLFHAALRRGAAPDEALRAAQRQMIAAGGSSASPAHWAGFVLMGRGTAPIY